MLHFDADNSMSIESALQHPERFELPATLHASLGARRMPVWLRIPLQVSPKSDGLWIFDVDYHALNKLDIYLTQNGRVLQTANMGNLRPVEQRPLSSRSHALPLELAPGQSYELLVRVETQGGMILPLGLYKPAAFHARATAEQMLQGLLLGIGLSLLMYSLAQWLSLREPLYLKYSILTAGSLMFSVLLFGVGTQYLWTNNLWMERHVGVLSALCASIGSFLFNEQSLRGPGTSLRFRHVMLGGAALGCVLAVIFALDIFDTTVMTSIISVLGPIPALLSIPGALDRARQRDPVGATLLVAWIAYFAAAAILIGLIAGKLPVNFWTLHSFEFGATIDMLAFMYVLSLRTKAVRLAAVRASQERDIMRSLAHTDPLTGLANRRSLSEALEAALTLSSADNQLAVYVIDVDGFKPVNDRFGHDAGDELLVGIARRLKQHVRSSDIVARLGGDEFVVLAGGLRQAQQAHELGNNLIEVFNEPFQLKEGVAHIGLTIGYALSPGDAKEASAVLHLADAAMYQGKQDGKRCLRRAAAPLGPSSRLQTQPA